VGQTLTEVVINVLDFGATGLGVSSDLPALQNAVRLVADMFHDRPAQVLFPAGDYLIDGPLYLGNAWQRTTFLAGARVTLGNKAACIVIGGGTEDATQQTVENLTVVGEGRDGSTPAVYVSTAAGLLVDGCRVTVSGAGAIAVRVHNQTGCTFEGGRILCEGERGAIGLQLYGTEPTNGAFEPMVTGLSIEGFTTGVQVACKTESPCFVDCDWRHNDVDMEFVASPEEAEGEVTVTSLTVTNCRFGGTGTARIRVAASARINSGVVTGCVFRAPAEDGAIFEINGSVNGVVVSGCSTFGEAGAGGAVWAFPTDVFVSKTGDLFNAWGDLTVRGFQADRVSVFSGDDDGELSVSNRSARFDVSALGLFGATPGERQDYTLAPGTTETFDCELAPLSEVLNSLVNELGRRGIVHRWVERHRPRFP